MNILKRNSQFLIISAIIVLSFSISQIKVTDPNLHLVRVTDPDALCLDGSQAAYYISKQGDPKKIYIEFQGGGWCTGVNSVSQTLQDCYQRTKGELGSSKKYAQTISLPNGVLSIGQQNNFREWTRVFFKYCDGSGHQGTKKNPVSYKGTNLFFRGHNSTVAKLNSLEKNNKLFSEATHVVVGGDSAGGLAVFLWTNYITQRVKAGKVWALPDSGIFLDSVNFATGKHDYKTMFKNLMSISNVQIAPPVPECVQKFGSAFENCMFAQNIAPFIKAPMFVLQSLYDTWSVYNIIGIKCIQDGSLHKCTDQQVGHIQEYHRNTTNAIFAMSSNNQNGFWAPACATHVFGFDPRYYDNQWRIPQGSQYSASKSIQNWLDNVPDATNFRYIDLGKWPDNKPCAGQTTFEWLRRD